MGSVGCRSSPVLTAFWVPGWQKSSSEATKVVAPKKDFPVRTITADRLRTAASERDVVELAREYLGEWLPEEIGRLPVECRPVKLRDGDDLGNLAVNLAIATTSFEIEPEDLRMVEELDAFIGSAC